MLFVGADGGGTKTKLAAFDDGRLVAQSVVGPLNYRNIPFETAAENLAEGLRALRIDQVSVRAMGIGDPALDDRPSESDKAAKGFYALLGERLPFPVHPRSDAYMTLFGLTGGKGPGVLVISGTGSMGIAQDGAGRTRVIGGWGRMAGEGGNAYAIGMEGVAAAARAFDGTGRETALCDALLSYAGVTEPRDIIPVMYADDGFDLAGFSREVARCAEQGDSESAGILDRQAEVLSKWAAELVAFSGADLVGVYGSLLTRNARIRSAFETKLLERTGVTAVCEPSVPAEEAAARYARLMMEED